MIKLNKLPKPEVLEQNCASWTQQYLKYINDGNKPPQTLKRRYNDPEIKNTLLQETKEKCAYCESRVTHVSFGDVEHMVPYSKRPNMIFEWSNLTCSCQKCNNAKLDYYEEDAPLVHPYHDEPENHIRFHGPWCVQAPADAKGQRTIERLKLNRPELLGPRIERLRRVVDLRDKYVSTPIAADKRMMKKLLDEEAQSDKEFSAMVRHFLVQDSFV